MNQSIVKVQELPWGAVEMVEIPVPDGTAGRLQLPDVQQLRNYGAQKITIQSLELITADVLTNGVITGLTNAPSTEAAKVVLVLYSEQWEKGHYIPLQRLNCTQTNAGTYAFSFYPVNLDDWEDVDWTKSYLQYANGTTPAGLPYCFMLRVGYQRWNVVNGVPIAVNGPR